MKPNPADGTSENPDPPREDGCSRQPIYAALDLGTNNCRLLMARPCGDSFRVIEAFSRITRLGEGLAKCGHLSEPAMSRTVSALRQCMFRLERRGAERVRAVATEACRRAVNCSDFIERVRRETGLQLEIISSDDEARLALAGCAPLLDHAHSCALVFDIGGGSTELVKVRLERQSEEIDQLSSLPVGVVTLAEETAGRLDTPDGYEGTVKLLTERFAAFDRTGALRHLAESGALQLLGTSGTVTTLGAIHLDLARYDRALVDGLVMSFPAIAAVSRRLVAASNAERANHPCIGEERADLVVAGCAILEAICRLWPVGRIRVADRGVREGILLSMMRADRLAVD